MNLTLFLNVSEIQDPRKARLKKDVVKTKQSAPSQGKQRNVPGPRQLQGQLPGQLTNFNTKKQLGVKGGRGDNPNLKTRPQSAANSSKVHQKAPRPLVNNKKSVVVAGGIAQGEVARKRKPQSSDEPGAKKRAVNDSKAVRDVKGRLEEPEDYIIAEGQRMEEPEDYVIAELNKKQVQKNKQKSERKADDEAKKAYNEHIRTLKKTSKEENNELLLASSKVADTGDKLAVESSNESMKTPPLPPKKRYLIEDDTVQKTLTQAVDTNEVEQNVQCNDDSVLKSLESKDQVKVNNVEDGKVEDTEVEDGKVEDVKVENNKEPIQDKGKDKDTEAYSNIYVIEEEDFPKSDKESEHNNGAEQRHLRDHNQYPPNFHGTRFVVLTKCS